MKATQTLENLCARIALLEKSYDDLKWENIFLKDEMDRLKSDESTHVQPTYFLYDAKSARSLRFIHYEKRYWLHCGDALAYIGKPREQASYYFKRWEGGAVKKFLIEAGSKGINWTFFATLTCFLIYTDKKVFDASILLEHFTSRNIPRLPRFQHNDR